MKMAHRKNIKISVERFETLTHHIKYVNILTAKFDFEKVKQNKVRQV